MKDCPLRAVLSTQLQITQVGNWRVMVISEMPVTSPDSTLVYERLDVLLRFAAAMMSAGNIAFRVREWTGVVADKMGLDTLHAHLSLGTVIATACRDREQAMVMREVSPPGVNVLRIGALERLAQEMERGTSAREVAAKLADPSCF